MPSPVPDAPEVIVIHEALLPADHEQPLLVETFTLPSSPCMGTLSVIGDIEYVHEGAGGGGAGGLLLAACVTVNARPAIVSVPVRAAPVLAATLNVTVPLPVPVEPDATVIHSTAVVAVHWHVAPAETVTGVPAPPAAAMFWLVGEIAVLHAGGGEGGAGTLTPACVTVGRWLTTAIEPVRAAPSLRATRKLTVPVPLPVADDVSAIQPTSTVAVHAHSLAVVIVRLPDPPVELTVCVDGVTS